MVGKERGEGREGGRRRLVSSRFGGITEGCLTTRIFLLGEPHLDGWLELFAGRRGRTMLLGIFLFSKRPRKKESQAQLRIAPNVHHLLPSSSPSFTLASSPLLILSDHPSISSPSISPLPTHSLACLPRSPCPSSPPRRLNRLQPTFSLTPQASTLLRSNPYALQSIKQE